MQAISIPLRPESEMITLSGHLCASLHVGNARQKQAGIKLQEYLERKDLIILIIIKFWYLKKYNGSIWIYKLVNIKITLFLPEHCIKKNMKFTKKNKTIITSTYNKVFLFQFYAPNIRHILLDYSLHRDEKIKWNWECQYLMDRCNKIPLSGVRH